MIYILDSTTVFFNVTGFEFAKLCEIKCKNIISLSYYCAFINYCIFAILLSAFNSPQKDCYNCCKFQTF